MAKMDWMDGKNEWNRGEKINVFGRFGRSMTKNGTERLGENGWVSGK